MLAVFQPTIGACYGFGCFFFFELQITIYKYMKNNDLRIGNLVLFYEDIVPITGIVKSGFYFGKNGFAINLLEWFKPIELNEKWLLNAGFKIVSEVDSIKEYRLERANMKCFSDYFDISLYVEFGETMTEIYTETKYVHQLQNLYFAIYGEDLVFSSTEP